eukprot:TRINITY_DN5749_c0_g1_i1.p1 TRINITY_DN5749_c0_g1~~TRINITY_DN5749_c0_g1_i1.p1  ORF type:complete len:254 (-),score=43.86 TRINITY_DN5749_c0_g1_i1:18-779(-)
MERIRDPVLLGLFEKVPSRCTTAVECVLNGNKGHHECTTTQRPTFVFYKELNTMPVFHDHSLFHWISLLKDQHQLILDEFTQIYQHHRSDLGQIRSAVKDGGVWFNYLLVDEGNVVDAHVAQCPKTWEILEQVPLLLGCCLGYCYFSVVLPGTVITPHYGVSNLKLRCQLPLMIPDVAKEDLVLRVEDDEIEYCVGEPVVFDDSFIHSVHFADAKSGERGDMENIRAVLLFDFWHPDLTGEEIELINYCLAAK